MSLEFEDNQQRVFKQPVQRDSFSIVALLVKRGIAPSESVATKWILWLCGTLILLSASAIMLAGGALNDKTVTYKLSDDAINKLPAELKMNLMYGTE